MQIKFFPILKSTNTWCIENIDNLPPKYCVVADQQTGGRGRSGDWISPLGNLYLSLILPITLDSKYLSLIVSYAIAEYYEKHSINLHIKWPNDIMLGKKKVGGVLVEIVPNIVTDSTKYSAVIGIGLNLTKKIDVNNPYYDTAHINDFRNTHSIAHEIAESIESAVHRFQFSKSFIPDYYKRKLIYKKNDIIQLTLRNGNKQKVVFLDVSMNGDIQFTYNSRNQQLPLEAIFVID